jgi:hypothetical protein
MAQAYYQRFPFLIDWSNVQGKTALHVAALKGNDDFARVCGWKSLAPFFKYKFLPPLDAL